MSETPTHTAEKDAGHRWQIDPEGNGHRARCSCGWKGHKRVRWADARREGDRHHHDATRVIPPAPSRQYVEDSCRTCADRHPLDGCADVGCRHNCDAEVRVIPPGTGDTDA